jgi:Cytidylate kinase-like family
MSAPLPVSQIDRWLCRPPAGPVRPFVTLNARPGTLPRRFAAELRDYLASLDDETDDWQAFDTPALLELVTHPLQATNSRALAPADNCLGCSCPGDDCGTRRKYKAAVTLVRRIARRGGAVAMMTGACRATRDFGHAFHVWFECSMEHRTQRWAEWNKITTTQAAEAITDTARREEDWLNAAFGPRSEGCGLFCHLTLNLDQMGSSPLIQIVGDTVLEWAAARARTPRLHSMPPPRLPTTIA